MCNAKVSNTYSWTCSVRAEPKWQWPSNSFNLFLILLWMIYLSLDGNQPTNYRSWIFMKYYPLNVNEPTSNHQEYSWYSLNVIKPTINQSFSITRNQRVLFTMYDIIFLLTQIFQSSITDTAFTRLDSE